MCDGTYGNDFSGIETYLTEEEVCSLRANDRFARAAKRIAQYHRELRLRECTGDGPDPISILRAEFGPDSDRLHLSESVCEAVERGDWTEIMAAMKAWKEGR